jgi:RimJ/RimL family protein N-acetyltransferase
MLYGKLSMLVPVEKTYAKTLQSFVIDKAVTQFVTHTFPVTIAEEEDWIESLQESDKNIVFAIRTNDADKKIIGTVGLHGVDWINRSATFGIMIGDKNYWNDGYGTEVTLMILYWGFNSLNLSRINSSAIAFNTRSIALHKKCGFVLEGAERKSIFKNGAYHDLVLLGLLKKEFLKKIYL